MLCCFRACSSSCCTASTDFLPGLDKQPRRECETHRNQVAGSVRRSDDAGRVAEDFAVGGGGDKVGEHHDEGQDHLHAQPLPGRDRLRVRDGGLQVSLVARQRDSAEERTKWLKLIRHVQRRENNCAINKCSPQSDEASPFAVIGV